MKGTARVFIPCVGRLENCIRALQLWTGYQCSDTTCMASSAMILLQYTSRACTTLIASQVISLIVSNPTGSHMGRYKMQPSRARNLVTTRMKDDLIKKQCSLVIQFHNTVIPYSIHRCVKNAVSAGLIQMFIFFLAQTNFIFLHTVNCSIIGNYCRSSGSVNKQREIPLVWNSYNLCQLRWSSFIEYNSATQIFYSIDSNFFFHINISAVVLKVRCLETSYLNLFNLKHKSFFSLIRLYIFDFQIPAASNFFNGLYIGSELKSFQAEQLIYWKKFGSEPVS